MQYKIGNIIKTQNGKLGVVAGGGNKHNTVSIITFDNPQYWGDDYSENKIELVMDGHPDLLDQIRNANSLEMCIKKYMSHNMDIGSKYHLLQYTNIKPKSKSSSSDMISIEYDTYSDLYIIIFDLKDMDMIKLWIDKNLPPEQDKDEVLKGCKLLLETITKSKVI